MMKRMMQFSLENMRCCDKRIIESVFKQLTEDEQNRSIVVRDGKTYLILGTEKAFLQGLYDEGWTHLQKEINIEVLYGTGIWVGRKCS